jgi:hypothetical protein
MRPVIDRRTFLSTLAGCLFATPLASEAQQPRVYRVGVIVQGGPYLGAVDGLRKGLAEMGFEEGKRFILHVRDGSGDLKVVEQAAGDLERENVDLIYSLGTRVTLPEAWQETHGHLQPVCGTHGEAPRAPEGDGSKAPPGRDRLQPYQISRLNWA